MLHIKEWFLHKSLRKKDCLEIVESGVQKLLWKRNHEQPQWYLPLQAVFAPERTAQVPIVFDASAKGSRGKSLNEHLEMGPNYEKSLPSVLMAWRFDKVGYTGDVQTSVTGLISLIYEKYYKLMEVLYIFPMIFKVKPIFNPI